MQLPDPANTNCCSICFSNRACITSPNAVKQNHPAAIANKKDAIRFPNLLPGDAENGILPNHQHAIHSANKKAMVGTTNPKLI